MKLLGYLCVILGTTCASASDFGIFMRRSKASTPSPSRHGSLPTVLSVRGGDIKDNLVATSTALFSIHGLVSLAAPEKVPKILYQGTFEIEEGTAAEMNQEYVGSTLLGIATMAYLAANTDVSATTNVVCGSAFCAYTLFRSLIKGTYEKLGFSKGYGSFATMNFLAMPLLGGAILSGKYDTDLLAKIYVTLPTLMGLVGYISPDTMESFTGGEVDDVSKSITGWWHTSLIVWGTLAYSLLEGSDVFEAVGRASIVFCLMCVDYNYIRKQNAPLDLSDAAKAIFPMIQLVIGAGLLKPAAAAVAE